MTFCNMQYPQNELKNFSTYISTMLFLHQHEKTLKIHSFAFNYLNVFHHQIIE